jgi:flagellar basal body L-ring protein FlgH
MKRTWIMVCALALASATPACVKKGSVTEASPMASGISAFRTAHVTVAGPPSAKNIEVLKTSILQKLTDTKLFAEVRADGGELLVQVVVKEVDQGSALATQLGGNAGAAEVQMDVTFVSTKDQKTVGQIAVMGNSKQNGSTSLGGVDMRALDDQTATAYAQAADQLATYLMAHR